jgi:hypothetical protein
MARAPAGLDGDEDWRKLFEIADYLGPPKLPTDNPTSFSSTPWSWNSRLEVIHADADGNVHWTLLSSGCGAEAPSSRWNERPSTPAHAGSLTDA